MSPRARAAVRLQEEEISYVTPSEECRAQALLDYDSEGTVDLLLHDVPSAPRDVTAGEARPVADVLGGTTFDEHVKVCEVCRKAGHALGTASTLGLARLTRDEGAQRAATWRVLCFDGKRIFIEHWSALGLGLPDYAQEPV